MSNIDGIAPGVGYPRGFILQEIIKYILNFDEGVEEPKIREYLFKDYRIKNLKTIKSHLEKLQFDGLIIKTEKSGRSNIWMLNYSNRDVVSKFLIDEFFSQNIISEEDGRKIEKLFYSKGMQKFILDNDFSDRFLFTILSITLVKPKEKKEEYIVDWNIPEKEKEKILEIIQAGLSQSPTLFCSLYYPTADHSLIFWSLFTENTLKQSQEKLEFQLVYYLVISATLIDYWRYRGNRLDLEKVPSPPIQIDRKLWTIFTNRIEEIERTRGDLRKNIENIVKFT